MSTFQIPDKAKHLFKKIGAEPIYLKILYLKLKMQGLVQYDEQSDTYIRQVAGSKLHLNPKDFGISRCLARDGIREKESVDALFQYVKPDMNILDLGANLGFYVVLEGQIISKGNGRILAIEPGPENLRLLRLNIALNKLEEKVTVVHGAVSNENGIAKLRISPLANCHRLIDSTAHNPDGETIDVPSYTFDRLLDYAKFSIQELDFLRMDIEGTEYVILDGILDSLKERKTFLMFIEFHPHVDKQKHVQILQRMEKMGFRCLTVTKEFSKLGRSCRLHCPNATIHDLYSDEIFLQFGGCEAFLQKG